MFRTIFQWTLTALLLFVPAVAGAALPEVEAIQRRYATVNTMQAGFVQVLTHAQSGRVERRKGTMSFAKPMSIRWDTVSPEREIQLIAPDVVWNVFPEDGVAYRYAPEVGAEFRQIVDLLTGQGTLSRDYDIEKAGTENGLTKLNLYPKGDKGSSISSAELLVNPKTGEIVAVTSVDFFHNRNAVTFSGQRINPTLPTGTFTFTPSPGMKVEDKRSEGARPGR